MESSIDTIRIEVYDKPDNSGPSLEFLSPQDNDSVGTKNIMAYIQAQDASKVDSVHARASFPGCCFGRPRI
jgi:hypothetical protein